jgi:DNA invertase Pin-like site-specific DNA recombinase
LKLIAYLRVSTATQVDDGAGLHVQEQAVRAWAKEHRHRIVGFAREEGVSGSNGIENCEVLPEVLAALQARQADGLVVYRLDRLARDLVLQEQLLAEVRRIGAEVFTSSDAEQGYLADDPDDPSRKLIRQVLGAVSEYQRAMIALRLRSGRRHKLLAGGFAGGTPRYGFAAVDGELVLDPEEQKALDRMREMRDGGFSLRAIADALTIEGYTTKRGGRWHPYTVARLLRERVHS